MESKIGFYVKNVRNKCASYEEKAFEPCKACLDWVRFPVSALEPCVALLFAAFFRGSRKEFHGVT